MAAISRRSVGRGGCTLSTMLRRDWFPCLVGRRNRVVVPARHRGYLRRRCQPRSSTMRPPERRTSALTRPKAACVGERNLATRRMAQQHPGLEAEVRSSSFQIPKGVPSRKRFEVRRAGKIAASKRIVCGSLPQQFGHRAKIVATARAAADEEDWKAPPSRGAPRL